MTIGKKLAIWPTIIMCLALLAPVGALADSISVPDTTDVQPWYNMTQAPDSGITAADGKTYRGNQYVDVIGGNEYDTSQVNIEWYNNSHSVRFTIYTNFPQGGDNPSMPADLVLALGGAGQYTYGVALTDHGDFTTGTVYKNATWYQPKDLGFGNGSWIYGGRYGDSPSPPYDQYPLTLTQLATGTLLNMGTVTWNKIDDPILGIYAILVDLGEVNDAGAFNTINFFWGTGTCANDGISGGGLNPHPVPAPGTLVLLGSGLVGLALLRNRKPHMGECPQASPVDEPVVR